MKARAFTLVELLVVVATTGIILALLLPALSGARRSAESAACFSRLGNAMQAHARFSASMKDTWLNPLPPGALFAIGQTGANGGTIMFSVLDTVWWWACFMGSELVDRGESGEAVTCPVVYRELEPGHDQELRAGAARSYWYSAAMVTDWRMWSTTNHTARLVPDKHRAVVGTSMVRHPSRKVVLFEWADRHGRGDKIDTPERSPNAMTNTAFADGHIERILVSDARPALRVAWPSTDTGQGILPSGEPMPFSSSADGYRGWDIDPSR